MAASDHLQPAQFRPIEEVGRMLSQYGDITMEQAYQDPHTRFGPDEQDYAHHKGFNSAEEHQAALREHIAHNGMQNPVVVAYGSDRTDQSGHPASGTVRNGHHRYFAARDLGWKHIPADTWGPQSRLKDVPGWGH